MSALSVSDLRAGYDPDLAIVKGVSFSVTRASPSASWGPMARENPP
jgi:hypothetical protein